MDRIPPIEPRSRFEPPLAPPRARPVPREGGGQRPADERRPRPRKPSGEKRGPSEGHGDGPHVDVRA